MKILLTGGSGMVGSNFLAVLAQTSYTVLAPTRRQLNLEDTKEIVSFLENEKPDIVVHAAGRVGGIQANIINPVAFFLENLDMGRNLVVACKEAGIKKLVNLGSSCIYPCNASSPLTEDMLLEGKLEPTNEGYALAKVAVLKLCEYITKTDTEYAYKTVIPCNLYGPGDKFSAMEAHLIPAVIAKLHQAVQNQQTEVEIWGDGTVRREFMFAQDFAKALFFLIEKFDQMPNIINVGIGHDYTINEYYQAVAEVVGYKGRFVHDLTKPVGMKQKLVDITKLKDMGWHQETGLVEGIATTYEYYKKALKHEGTLSI